VSPARLPALGALRLVRRRAFCDIMRPTPLFMLKLQQDQIWKIDAGFLKITRLERLAVGYKFFASLTERRGIPREATKKHFCRLIKTGTLLTTDEVRDARMP